MSSHRYDYLDGNAAAGELNEVFTMDVTTAEEQCAHCGGIKRFAEAHLYTHGPGIVVRCPECDHVILRFVSIRGRVFLDLRGMAYLRLEIPQARAVTKE